MNGLHGGQDNHYWGGVLQFAIWETLSNDNVKEPNLMQVNRLDMSWCHCMDKKMPSQTDVAP